MTETVYDWRDFHHLHLHCELDVHAHVSQVLAHIARQMKLNDAARQQAEALALALASPVVQRVATHVEAGRMAGTENQAHG